MFIHKNHSNTDFNINLGGISLFFTDKQFLFYFIFFDKTDKRFLKSETPDNFKLKEPLISDHHQ